MTRTAQNEKTATTNNKESKRSYKNGLWPEEEQALEDIKTGKTIMRKQSGKEFLKDLEATVNE